MFRENISDLKLTFLVSIANSTYRQDVLLDLMWRGSIPLTILCLNKSVCSIFWLYK